MRSWLIVPVVLVLMVVGCSKDTPNPSAGDVKSTIASQPSIAPAKREPIYDEKADPQADIARALEKAGKANKRVLVIFGGNWCSWCYRFDDLLKKHPEISRIVERSYEVVHVEAVKHPGSGRSTEPTRRRATRI